MKSLEDDVMVVFRLGVLAVESTNKSVDDAFNHVGGVVGVGRDVLIEIHRFLVGASDNSAVLDGDGEVEEVDGCWTALRTPRLRCRSCSCRA